MAVDLLWNENSDLHNAIQYRQMVAMMAGTKLRALGGSASSGTGNGGVSETDALKVVQRGAGANMSVDVGIGGCTVGGTTTASRGDYFVQNDAVKNVVIDPADPSNPRIDIVGVRVRDTAYSEAADDVDIVAIKGDADPAPVEPALPANFLTLARVDVAAGAGSITNANITDRRVLWGAATAAGTPGVIQINAQSGAGYTLALTDTGKLVTLSNASAQNLTVPPNASVAFAIGAVIALQSIGAGIWTITPGGGVTVSATPGLKIRAQYSRASLVKTATNTWLAAGDLSA